jgi:hypothetical protein
MEKLSSPHETKANYVVWNRRWVVFKRHLPIVLKPFVAGIIVMIIWRFIIFRFDLSFSKETENPILFIVITLTAFAYAIFAGYAVNAVLTDYKEISKAVVRDDVDTFLLYRDEQLPILMHLLIGSTSFFIIAFTLLFPYSGAAIGMASNFTVTFILTLVYIIVTELDDYYHSIWFKEKIPSEWYKIDISEHFKKKK